MAEFKIERFKYNWKGEWAPNTEYLKDDVVYISGKSYVCLTGHTSASLFNDDLTRILPGSEPPVPDPYWVVMISSRTFAGDYTLGNSYNIGDIVLYGGALYECINGHVATNFANQTENWKVTLEFINFLNNWETSTPYGKNALVKYNGIVYKCIFPHISAATLEENISDWEIFLQGIEWRGNWQQGQEYRLNDWVRFGGSIFSCIETHTATSSGLDTTKFVTEFVGSAFQGDWNSTTVYGEGDIVRFGGYVYIAREQNVNSDPSGNDNTPSDSWIILAKTNNFRGEFNLETEYKTGDIVQRGGYLYEAIRDVNRESYDASTLGYLNTEVWTLISKGQRYAGIWVPEVRYAVGDLVYYLGSTYICETEHLSAEDNSPTSTEFLFWSIAVESNELGGMRETGDLLTYGLLNEELEDFSTLGKKSIPIGEEYQLLSVDELEVFWRNRLFDSEVVYVGTNGVDDEGYGTEESTPFKTVRYACEYVEDNFAPLTPVKIKVATGRYEEIGPISIPAGCAVVGDELRSTTIAASGPLEEYQNRLELEESIIIHLDAFIGDVVLNQPVATTQGNLTPQVFTEDQSSVAVLPVIVDILDDYLNKIRFLAYSGNTNPDLSGSNELNSEARLNASNNIRRNIDFIIAEVVAYVNVIFPEFQNDNFVRKNMRSLLRGIIRDVKFDGNYGVLKAAEKYANSVRGAQLIDLFYCRDTTGVRNCTIEGLRGTLNPPGVFDLFQRPTGGACVSLDPGWGPDDERVWIKNRSPYIQGVTNIGERCTGKKVDGALHNGGNRSMVSNDFTQVLSDGIGAWVLNNGRTELVSVFTYYCQVGYLAENGGVIRSAQGNNSYGTYGAVADGNNPDETPQQVEVFNRNNEAQIRQAIAGGLADQILTFEYENCGENYTQADASISGAGADANVEYTDFRDGAVFEARLINTKGSGSKGGSNYTLRSFSAQITPDASNTIKLSTNDPTQFALEILGLRIIITSGKGVGQYGIISAFNGSTRDVTVVKESDGTLGWDHIIPGTPLVEDIDSTTRYSIEPLISATEPEFVATTYDTPQERTIVDVTFGNTTESYFNIEVNIGTGETFDDEAIAAIFNVERKGETYNVTLVSGGAGYAVGDTLVIPGTSLGGESPENDCIIDVTSVSEDSTNSILSFTTEGTPRGGRFVGIAQPNFAFYSDDGITVTESNTSFVGDYKAIAAGNDVFVAIASNTNTVSYTTNGVEWVTRSLPTSNNWADIAYGKGKFVIIAENSNDVVFSEDGLNWTSATIPDGADSTTAQWQGISYGQGRFVIISGSANAVAISEDGENWQRLDGVLGTEFYDWASLAYGDNRFLAVDKDGRTLFSLDKGETWLEGATIPNNNIANLVVRDVKFSQGVFFAVVTAGELETNYCYTSEYGILWNERVLPNERVWSSVAYGQENGSGSWLLVASGSQFNSLANIKTGRKAIFRGELFQGTFQVVKILDPGSGYTDDNPCEITVFDPNFITEVEIAVRQGSGTLPQPDFINRGAGYRSSSSTIEIEGNGFADIIPEDQELTLSGVSVVPGPGVQIRISGILDLDTPVPDDLELFAGVSITDLGDDGTRRGTRLVRFLISPRLINEYNLEHGTPATLLSQYSQCRISGHDFLDIGTGNFEDTNYPEIYAGGNFFVASPENEVEEINGGRVFYTSTDQDGNFRTGELFAVSQGTGIVTISAEFFDLDGLSELALGGIRLGGSGAVVNEFSTDPTFSADSNNIIPTQRAIASFLADRLSVGGENLETNLITAGRTRVGGSENEISTSSGEILNIPRPVNFDGVDLNQFPTEIQGTIIQQMMFLRDFTDSIQQ